MTRRAKVALVSLGCPKNLVDSQVMLGILEAAGYEIVDDTEDADVAIVNTCSFIAPAEEEAIDALLDLADLKQSKLKALICAGCLTERHGHELLDELAEVDAFVGVGGIPTIAQTVARALAGERFLVEASRDYLYRGETPRLHTGRSWLSYLKIADGCDHQCAFCTIPSIRGDYRSVPVADVVAQFEELVREGFSEVTLIGQDTSAYGRDLQPRATLLELLDRLCEVGYDGWLRLLYLYPSLVTDDLIARICSGPPLVPYFDIPLQHVSRDVLKAMRRAGSAESYLELVGRIRRADPRAAIRTTFIVGHPGETEQDFEALLEFVGTARLDRVTAFVYSPEEGTPAAEIDEQVDPQVALERFDELMRVQEEVSLEINRGFVGEEMRVLLESPADRQDLWFGRTYRDAPDVDTQIRVDTRGYAGKLEPGDFVQVEIKTAEVHDLQGRIVDISAPNSEKEH
ncbi:MAG: 30S ribosomal protein S12 methylthiotransferase RimO [Armatimonadetes bacterium]|nr:30S ribosomal protein S12 methylthiotransferase RimO [Armatimonadota bacterium]